MKGPSEVITVDVEKIVLLVMLDAEALVMSFFESGDTTKLHDNLDKLRKRLAGIPDLDTLLKLRWDVLFTALTAGIPAPNDYPDFTA